LPKRGGGGRLSLMNPLHDFVGAEAGLPEVARAVLGLGRSFDVAVVGGYHVTCSDETEGEVAEVFDKVLVETMLPALKPERRAAFRTMNLGGRYEPGAIRIAEHHYATRASGGRAKVMVVKINSHVAARSTADGPWYGRLVRYGVESACCGALGAMLEGAALPAAEELRRTFCGDGVDRIAMLGDASRVAPAERALVAAVSNARLQAGRAVADAVGYCPHSPTVFLVVACVTINRAADDTEVVVGYYVVDATGERPTVCYRGLGDVPTQYRLGHRDGRIVLEDEEWPELLEEAEEQSEAVEDGLGDVPAAYRLSRQEGRSILDDDRWPEGAG